MSENGGALNFPGSKESLHAGSGFVFQCFCPCISMCLGRAQATVYHLIGSVFSRPGAVAPGVKRSVQASPALTKDSTQPSLIGERAAPTQAKFGAGLSQVSQASSFGHIYGHSSWGWATVKAKIL